MKNTKTKNSKKYKNKLLSIIKRKNYKSIQNSTKNS